MHWLECTRAFQATAEGCCTREHGDDGSIIHEQHKHSDGDDVNLNDDDDENDDDDNLDVYDNEANENYTYDDNERVLMKCCARDYNVALIEIHAIYMMSILLCICPTTSGSSTVVLVPGSDPKAEGKQGVYRDQYERY